MRGSSASTASWATGVLLAPTSDRRAGRPEEVSLLRATRWLLLLLAAALCARAGADEPQAAAVTDIAELWQEPTDLESRDLLQGAGPKELEPSVNEHFVLLGRKTTGFSRGFDLRDGGGREWSMKYGPEAKVEVAISRLLWAIGFHQPPTWFVENWYLEGGDKPGPQTP